MKSIIKILIISLLTLNSISCEKNTEENIDFYNSSHRIGLWINSEREDTLEFVNNSDLIRKGIPYSYEEYLYRIDGEILFVRLPGTSNETQHSILTTEKNNVVLGNMYITGGFLDNSGTFIKQD